MPTYNQSVLENVALTHQGIRVDSAAALVTAAAVTKFTVTGGNVIMTGFYGEIMVDIINTATVVIVTHTPTVGTASILAILAGGTDIFPYFSHEGDVSFFAEGMKQLCGRHGQDYEKLRKTRADFFMSKYRKEKVGAHAGIYSFHLEDNHFDFFKEMAEAFFTLYTGIVEKRKGKPFTDEEKKLMKKIHGVWAQWVLLEDEGTKYGLEKGIPPDALLGAILPPNATF
jgi:coproporphyrinogen III oxidase